MTTLVLDQSSKPNAQTNAIADSLNAPHSCRGKSQRCLSNFGLSISTHLQEGVAGSCDSRPTPLITVMPQGITKPASHHRMTADRWSVSSTAGFCSKPGQQLAGTGFYAVR